MTLDGWVVVERTVDDSRVQQACCSLKVMLARRPVGDGIVYGFLTKTRMLVEPPRPSQILLDLAV